MGTGVIVLPRRVAEFAGQDGWLIVLGLIIMAMLVGALIGSAINAISITTPNISFLESLKILLTRPVAYIIGVVLWLKIVLSAGLELRVFMGITQEVLLPRTPMFIVSATMLLVCGYAAAKGIETRARVAEVLLILMILPFIFLVGVGFWTSDFSNLQPSFTSSPTSLISGVLRLGFIFTGLEMLLLVAPFLTTHNKTNTTHSKENAVEASSPERRGLGQYPTKNELKKAVVSALLIAGLVIVIITVLTIAEFGVGILDQSFPVLSMIDMLGIPSEFIERQGALMFSFWIITAFTLGNAMLFFGGLLVKDVFRHKKLTVGVLVTTVAVFLLTLMPFTIGQIYQWLDFMYMTLDILFMVVLPIFIVVSAKIKKNSTKDDGKRVTKTSFSGRGVTYLVVLCSCLFLLTSCWDNIAIENRDFVTIIGIDKAEKEEGYTVTLSIPSLSKKSDDIDEDKLKSATAATITEAIQKINTDNRLYFGHAKLVILGDELLSEKELVENTLNVLNNHREIDLRIYVLASDSTALEILETKVPYDKIPGCFTLDFECLYSALKHNNGALIPLVELSKDEDEDDEPQPTGAVAINDYQQVGKLDSDELRGFLWCVSNKNKGIVVMSDFPLTVEKHTVRTQFTDDFVIINIKITGRVEESPYNASNITPAILNKIQQDLALQIKEEIIQSISILQDEFNLNGLDYAPRWYHPNKKFEIMPIVTVSAKF